MRSLNLRFATLQHVTLHPTKEGGKAVMTIRTPLTPEIAEKLGANRMCYQENGLINERFEKAPLRLVGLDFDARVKVGGEEIQLTPQKAWAFHAFRTGDEEGTQLTMQFRIHMVGKEDIAKAFAIYSAVNHEQFGFKISSRQGNLFEAAGPEDDEADETEVEAAGDEEASSQTLARATETHQHKRRRTPQGTLPAGEQDTTVLKGIGKRSAEGQPN